MKQASQQIFGGMSRVNRLTDAEAKEMERETGSEATISKYAPIPDMKRVWSSLPRVHYHNSNRVVEQMAHSEHEFSNEMTPWNVGEVRIFLERLAMYGRNFKRISANLPDKTEKDCVEFYYRFKIHLNMKQIVSAGNQSRLRNNADASAVQNYRVLVDQAIEDLEEFLTASDSSHVGGRRMLEKWNIEKTPEMRPVDKVYGRDADPESPRRERRNAIIDVLVSVISKGHSIPPQLALLVESTSSVTTPAILSPPSLILATPPVPQRKLSLSMVQTAVTVLQINAPPTETRLLQAHNTI
jgi:hypothetical protein